jgi:hypothetical protein
MLGMSSWWSTDLVAGTWLLSAPVREVAAAADRDAMTLVLSGLLFVPLENNHGLLGNSAASTAVDLALAGHKPNDGFIL